MDFVLAVFRLKYGFIIVQVLVYYRSISSYGTMKILCSYPTDTVLGNGTRFEGKVALAIHNNTVTAVYAFMR